MPGLYGYSSNANVSVGNTTGLYQQPAGNVSIFNSAQTLYSLLGNSASVGFYLNSTNTTVFSTVLNSGVTAGTYGNTSLVPVITVGADGRITSVTTVAPTVSTYGNANVAVYLASNTDPTISNLNANTQQQQLQINTISANVGAFETYANIYFANLQANSNTYSNANVFSYMPIYTRSLPNLSSLNTAGNITANTGSGYFVGDGRYLVNLPTQAGTYSNANVASYLPVYTGNFGNTSSTIQILGSGVPTYGASITVGAFNQANINLGGSGLYASNVTIYKTDTTSFQGNTYILNYLPGGINAPTATGGYLTVSNTATVGNIVTTNGIFWSNGAVYSPTNTYGNTQVTALLASGTIAVNGTSILSTGSLITSSSSNTIFNAVQPTGALGVPYGGVGIGLDLYVRGNILNLGTANIGNITTVSGVFWSNGQPYSSGSGTYGNANVAAYLPTYSGNLSPGNVLTNNYLYANGTSIFTGITSNAASQQTQINAINANVTAANLTISTLQANVGAFETYANIYFANLQANSNTYSNANVASYLPVYSGHIGNVSSTINITGGAGTLQVGGTTGFSNVTIGGTGSYAGNVVVFGTDINDFGNVYVLNRSPSFGSSPTATGGYLTVSNTATVNALVTTTGVFWGNGSAYQPGGGGGSYGNLQVAQFLPISTDNFGGNLVNTLASNANIRITTLGANAVIDAHSTTTGLSLPTGANSQRPYNPWAGTIRYNSDIYAPEYWSGNAWVAFGSNVVVPTTTITTNYLLIAGGGAGATRLGGGGGAGGYVAGATTITLDGTAYSVVVGAGGTGTACVAHGASGSNSTISGGAISLSTIGGGGGGTFSTGNGAQNGGSGGGGGDGESGGSNTGGSGTSGQGNAGGNGYQGNPYAGGGGGGAVTVGQNSSSSATIGANGGNGLTSSITGSCLTYAGGGGAGYYHNISGCFGGVGGSGGSGGGGAGGGTTYSLTSGPTGVYGVSGTTNTGGGGGGAGFYKGTPCNQLAGSGGSGVAIFSYNSTTQKMSGGAVTTYGSGACTYYVHTFTGSGTLTASYTASVTYTASYLVVAGGGGGGRAGAAGGGAGGLLSSTATLTTGTTYTIVVGAGGSAGTSASSPGNHGGSGYCSTALGLTAIGGGGGGGSSNPNGFSGGSGGGGGGSASGVGNGGSGTSGQGTSGGTTTYYGSPYPGSGGGGAGVAGANASGSTPGNGGNGLQISITGTATYYAGGGGGAAAASSGTGGTGGAGGGGNGINGNSSCGIAGTANTGGGGGAGWNGCLGGAAGGSGVVILSVPTANYSGTTTGSPTITTSGSNTIIKFTASGSYTA